MLRSDPGEGRIRTARSFQVWEGAAEEAMPTLADLRGPGAIGPA
ncbi:hypothetical protein [Streptomyces vilmorinianum]|nr:hypothetical protein [Streptomyces vilmorinianum]